MQHDEEMYETIEEYLDSAILVIKEMYDEHGYKIFDLLETDFDLIGEYQEKTYELTEVMHNGPLIFFKDVYLKELNEAFNHEVSVLVNAEKDKDGHLEFQICIADTIITLHKYGRNVNYGENTPVEIKTIIRDVVM